MKALIINYNRLTLPKNMADYIAECGLEPVFIDNNSKYEPLLEYYENCPHEVVRLNQNYGHRVVWDADILNRLKIEGEYIVTDPDLDISNIPKDFLEVLQEGLNRYPKYEKCGFSLRISDLPNNGLTQYVNISERGYWARPLDDMYFDASTDTTFCIYRVNVKSFNSLRTNEPYCAKHVPWYYTNINDLPDDERYYFRSIGTSTYYSHLLR